MGSLECQLETFFFLQNTSTVCWETPGLRYGSFSSSHTCTLRSSLHARSDDDVYVLSPQATSCTALEMPTSSEILQVILEYIYTDQSPTIIGNFLSDMLTGSTFDMA